MKIQCLLGPTEQVVCGETYVFAPDRYGRNVAVIHDHKHASIFTEVEHYIEVPDVPQEPEQVTPAAGGPTKEELEAQAEAARIAAAAEIAARAAAEQAQARAIAEEAERQALFKPAELPADPAPFTPVSEAAPQADAIPSSTDNLDTASSQSNDEPVRLPVPKTRRGASRKARAK